MAGTKGSQARVKLSSHKATTKLSPREEVSTSSAIDTNVDETGPQPWLMNLVYQHAANVGMNISDLTEQLGYSAGYLFTLKAHPYKCSKLGMDTVRKLADFLGVDSMTVMVAAGILRPHDFFGVDDPRKIRPELVRAVRYISEDLDWAPFVPQPVELMDDRMLMLTVYAYQRATRKSLMTIRAPSKVISDGQKAIRKASRSRGK